MGMGGMGMGGMGMGGMGGMMGNGMGGMKGGKGGSGGGFKRKEAPNTGDANKDELINRIKAFQRSDPSQKEQWWNYCDTHLSGNRDPARHDAETLEDFCVCH